MKGTGFVYVLDIEYPEGSFQLGWKPEGWGENDGIHGKYISWTGDFRWPKSRYQYFSQYSAKSRARLLTMYGAKVTIYKARIGDYVEIEGWPS